MKQGQATAEVVEIFRGHLSDCLRHFGDLFNARIPKRHRGRSEVLQPMADFFGASVQTVRRWLDDESYAVPRGELGIKLMCYLDLHGYKIIEFKRMPIPRRNLTELIGFGAVSAKEVAQLLGYHDAQQVYAVTYGSDGMSKNRENLVWEIWKDRQGLLEAKRQEAFAKSRLEIIFQPVSVPVSRTAAIQNIMEGTLVLLDGLPDEELLKFAEPICRLSSKINVLKEK